MSASVICVLAGYLIGSISFAVLISRVFGLPDPRSYGSGNPGATNVLRSGKKAAALLTLFGDALKGVAAVLLARALAGQSAFGEATVAATAVAAFLGHLYPAFFRFKGGKGVATAAGLLCALSLPLGLLTLGVWLLVVLASRYVSLASVAAALAAALAAPPLLAWGPAAGAAILMAALIWWRHRVNLQRLLAGTESRLKFSRIKPNV